MADAIAELDADLARAQAEGNDQIVSIITQKRDALMRRNPEQPKGRGTASAPAAPPVAAAPAAGYSPGIVEQAGDVVSDFGRSAYEGAKKGFWGIPGTLADIGSMAQAGTDYVRSKATGRSFKEQQAESAKHFVIPKETLEAYGGDAYRKQAEEKLGIDFSHEPQTIAGKIAKVGGEFAGGGGFLGAGGLKALPMARNAATAFGVGAASESAGQAVDPLGLEFGGVPAGTIARLGTAVVGGAATARRGTSSGTRQVKDALKNATDEQLDAAQALVAKARSEGVNLPYLHAVDHVTGGSTGGKLLADVEAHPQGRALTEWLDKQQSQGKAAATRTINEQHGGPIHSESALDAQLDEAIKGIRGESPTGQQLTAQIAAAPNVSPEQAGRVIQPELAADRAALEKTRAGIGAEYEDVYKNAPADRPQYPAQRDPDTGQMLPLARGQVQAGPIAEKIRTAAQPHAGGIQRGLENAADMLIDKGTGLAKMTVEQLHNVRKAIDVMIEKGTPTKKQALGELARNPISAELKSVPGFADVDTRYAGALEQLKPYREGPLGPALEAHPSEVPGRLQTPAGAEALAGRMPAGTAPHSAMSDRIMSDAIAKSGGYDRNISADSLRKYIDDNKDTLQHFPDARARLEQMAQTRTDLDSVLTGRLKTLYDKGEVTTTKMINDLFELGPGAGAKADVSDAITKLNARDPVATQKLVQSLLEKRMGAAWGENVGGPSRSSSAQFANLLTGEGTGAQREIFLDAVKQTLGGQKADQWASLVDVLSATGKRQGVGSPTAGRAARFEELGTPSLKGAALTAGVAAAAGGATAGTLSVARSAINKLSQWSQSAGIKEISRLMMDPRAEKQLRIIAASNGRGARAEAALGRLAVLAERQQATAEEGK